MLLKAGKCGPFYLELFHYSLAFGAAPSSQLFELFDANLGDGSRLILVLPHLFPAVGHHSKSRKCPETGYDALQKPSCVLGKDHGVFQLSL